MLETKLLDLTIGDVLTLLALYGVSVFTLCGITLAVALWLRRRGKL